MNHLNRKWDSVNSQVAAIKFAIAVMLRIRNDLDTLKKNKFITGTKKKIKFCGNERWLEDQAKELWLEPAAEEIKAGTITRKQ